MSRPGSDQRVERLLRWYPPGWRERYGDEFGELLRAELEERPDCWRRSLDVIRAGLAARLSTAGLSAGPMASPAAALAAGAVSIIGFIALGTSLWAQLVGGSMGTSPDSHAAALGITVLTVTGVALAALVTLAVAPVVVAAARAMRRGETRLRLPILMSLTAVLVLVIGGHHFAGRWPAATSGTDSAAVHVGGYGWAETFGISTFWIHPHTLVMLAPGELVWMCISPCAFVTLVTGAVLILRRTTQSDAVLRFEARLVSVAAIAMAPALAAATAWVVSSQHDPNLALRAGTLDLGLIAAMAVAVATAGAAAEVIRGTTKRARRFG